MFLWKKKEEKKEKTNREGTKLHWPVSESYNTVKYRKGAVGLNFWALFGRFRSQNETWLQSLRKKHYKRHRFCHILLALIHEKFRNQKLGHLLHHHLPPWLWMVLVTTPLLFTPFSSLIFLKFFQYSLIYCDLIKKTLKLIIYHCYN